MFAFVPYQIRAAFGRPGGGRGRRIESIGPLAFFCTILFDLDSYIFLI